jgi:hypothetical protein
VRISGLLWHLCSNDEFSTRNEAGLYCHLIY